MNYRMNEFIFLEECQQLLRVDKNMSFDKFTVTLN